MKKGAYQKKLQNTFIVIALCMVLIFGTLMTWLMLSIQRSNYQFALQHTIAAKSSATRVTLSTILSALVSLQKSDAAASWAHSETQGEFYFYAAKLLEQIGKTTTNISLVDYDIFITHPDVNSLVVGLSGTQSKSMFFKPTGSGLEAEALGNILSHFEQSNDALVLPLYQGEELATLYYIVQQNYEDGPLLYFVRIPADTLFGKDTNDSFVLFDGEEALAYSTLDSGTLRALQTSHAFVAEQKYSVLEPYVHLSRGGKNIFLVFAPPLPWTILYQYPYLPLSVPRTVALIFVPLLVFAAACFFIFSRLSQRLYGPIGKVISGVELPAEGDLLDEFQIISKNIGTVSSLNKQLQNAIDENSALVTRRYYRELLFGIPDLDCPLSADQMSAAYCVALVEFDPGTQDSDWYLHLQKNCLYVYVQDLYSKHNIYYINDDYNTGAVILQARTRKEAEELIATFFTAPQITARLRIALSDLYEGVIHICEAYQQALQILDYRYSLPDLSLITSSHTSTLPSESYYYPLIIENRLVQAIASGNPASVEIYDGIIDENCKQHTLSPDVRRNFIYALISTLMRAFQELKTTPETLLGGAIDFQRLYEGWNDAQITAVLRDHIKNVVVSIQRRHDSLDNELLHRMLDYVRANYQDDIMLADIAEHCNISSTYCSTLFKRLSNDNFKNYLNRYRIERACEMIEQNPDVKISDLCAKVGFNSSNSFIRVFGKITGITPKAYADKCKRAH